MRLRTFLRWLLLICSIMSSVLLMLCHWLIAPVSVHAATRDPLQWPFAPTSIWNMPIGANARYVDATIGSRGFGTDIDWFVATSATDPLVHTYMPGAWGQGRCTGTTPQQQAQWHPEAAQPLHVPADLVIPDAITSGGIYSTPNNSSAFLQPDGKTLVSFNVTARCQAGGPLYGNWFGLSDLYGDGISGGHGGSALSSIGGSIRTGELLNDQPLHHALKIDIWGNWMHYDTTGQGHRWPAPLADVGAPQQYKGNNPALVMGSLLALPSNVTPESLGITSAFGKKLFYAFQNYGAYVVDDTGGDFNALCVEHNADVEFKQVMGHAIEQDQPLIADFNRMIGAVKVVDNNSPTSIGGGGTPRVPLAPAFGVPMTQPTTATPVATVQPVSSASATVAGNNGSHYPAQVNIGQGTQLASRTAHTGSSSSPGARPVGTLSTRQTPEGNFPWIMPALLIFFILLGSSGWFLWQRHRRSPD